MVEIYEILLTEEAYRAYEDADPVLTKKLNRCFQYLGETPHAHPNIKRLSGSLAGCYRYRLGNWRVVYQIDEEQHQVTVLLIAHRRETYR
jgi:mRNA interferase RelE/StbE